MREFFYVTKSYEEFNSCPHCSKRDLVVTELSDFQTFYCTSCNTDFELNVNTNCVRSLGQRKIHNNKSHFATNEDAKIIARCHLGEQPIKKGLKAYALRVPGKVSPVPSNNECKEANTKIV